LFLGTGAGLQALQIGAGAGELSLQGVEARLEFVRTQSCDEITLGHALALADGQIDEEAGDLEGEFDLFGSIDAAGKSAAAGVRASGDDQGADGADEFGRCFRGARAGGEEQGGGGRAGEEEVNGAGYHRGISRLHAVARSYEKGISRAAGGRRQDILPRVIPLTKSFWAMGKAGVKGVCRWGHLRPGKVGLRLAGKVSSSQAGAPVLLGKGKRMESFRDCYDA